MVKYLIAVDHKTHLSPDLEIDFMFNIWHYGAKIFSVSEESLIQLRLMIPSDRIKLILEHEEFLRFLETLPSNYEKDDRKKKWSLMTDVLFSKSICSTITIYSHNNAWVWDNNHWRDVL